MNEPHQPPALVAAQDEHAFRIRMEQERRDLDERSQRNRARLNEIQVRVINQRTEDVAHEP